MQLLINYLIIFFSLVFLLTILTEYFKVRSTTLLFGQLLFLSGFLLVLHFVTGFPRDPGIIAFGNTNLSILYSIGIMFICTLLGISAHHFYYLNKAFSLRKFLKPLLISPIIFLPLVGSVQGLPYLENMQLVSFSILAFQNGFFWKAVFDKAQPTT